MEQPVQSSLLGDSWAQPCGVPDSCFPVEQLLASPGEAPELEFLTAPSGRASAPRLAGGSLLLGQGHAGVLVSRSPCRWLALGCAPTQRVHGPLSSAKPKALMHENCLFWSSFTLCFPARRETVRSCLLAACSCVKVSLSGAPSIELEYKPKARLIPGPDCVRAVLEVHTSTEQAQQLGAVRSPGVAVCWLSAGVHGPCPLKMAGLCRDISGSVS